MATITPSIAPGSYAARQQIQLNCSSDIVSVAVTVNSAPPSISKCIGFDDLTPRNPFISVSEDGRGNVVYDGAHIKLRNGNITAAMSTYELLNNNGKYFINCLRYTANPAKVAAGNWKVLVIGDATSAMTGNVKSTATSGFSRSLGQMIAIAGGTATYVDPSDYPNGILNPTKAFLDQFSCMVFMALNDVITTPAITDSALEAIVAFREEGNGIIMHTGKGNTLNSIEDVWTPGAGSLFKTGNAIAYQFGAYYSGTFSRASNLTVGYLKSTYGNHPLYEGLPDSLIVDGSVNSSMLLVTVADLVSPSALAQKSFIVGKTGKNTINVLAKLADGSTITKRFYYDIANTEIKPILCELLPGTYLGTKTAELSFDPSIVKAEVTVNTAPPSISKYIAYDDLVPPKPFIAVSESGNSGKVVYDGGLPKFFNMNNPAAATFSGLTPAGKYLHNAIKWVVNPAKIAQNGSFKILFIGDTSTTTQYHLKGVDDEGFYNAYKNIAEVAGGIPTFLDLNDYDGVKLNPTLAYLEQFACVVLFSLNFDITLPAITQSAVDAFAAYRANSNGVIINTDHGHVLNSIEDTKLVQSGNFFKTANAVAYNFGAYFTGEFDRQPVTVGYLRTNYGDHPLYKNLLDTDSIYLGLSESTISIVPNNLVNPSTITPINLSKTGANVINVYAEDAAGNSSIVSFNYFIESTVTTPILPSVAPGIYIGSKVVSLSFDPNLVQAEVTVNAAPPSISKYIAYDDLVPPKPFIAVTEDGNTGRVVYDGGAPKFWNQHNPSNAASFFELTPSGKYLYNALRWVRNPVKVIDNSFKVLVIGDMANNAYYDIKPDSTGLDISGIVYKNIIEVAGGVHTFMNLSDYDGLKLNPTLAYLEQFACVILVSMNQTISLPAITEQAVAALVAYRAAGNGLVIHTDHGNNITNIEDTKLPGTGNFFKTANAVAYQFGAYFTGYYDRQPVSVGYLRQNYGDHPLYNNLTDSEFIYAGGSESAISIVPNNLKPISQIAPFSLNKNGTNTINVYALDGSGNSTIKSFNYQLQIEEFLTVTSFNPTTGEEVSNLDYVGSNAAGQLTLSVTANTSILGDIKGKISLNDKPVGGFFSVNNITELGWYGGAMQNLPVRFDDVLKIEIVSPVLQTREYQVLRKEIPPLAQDFVSLSTLMAMCKQVDLFTVPTPLSIAGSVKALSAIINEFTMRDYYYPEENTVAGALKQFKAFSRNELQVGPINAFIFSNEAEFTTWVRANTTALLTAYIIANTGEIYEVTTTGRTPVYSKVLGLTAKDLFGAPRVLSSNTSGTLKNYRLNLNGSLTLLV